MSTAQFLARDSGLNETGFAAARGSTVKRDALLVLFAVQILSVAVIRLSVPVITVPSDSIRLSSDLAVAEAPDHNCTRVYVDDRSVSDLQEDTEAGRRRWSSISNSMQPAPRTRLDADLASHHAWGSDQRTLVSPEGYFPLRC